jgi:hypothetical protein
LLVMEIYDAAPGGVVRNVTLRGNTGRNFRIDLH